MESSIAAVNIPIELVEIVGAPGIVLPVAIIGSKYIVIGFTHFL